jgi:hypothetical protein
MTSARTLLLAILATATPLAQAASWLDRPLAPWNAAPAIPTAPRSPESPAALAKRCAAVVATGRIADALSARGWTPFLHIDRQIARDGVEVIGGMAAAGPGCEPMAFNLFVFDDGRFAGVLSPSSMRTARDGVAGAVRLTGNDALTVEFARYTAADSECCPSSVVRVTYRLNRAGPAPVLEAVQARPVR